ncbi:MAG: hypothetical protein M3428_04145 [Pseudomonadota bacterium]|nr:hypothetical protein [Pseudomonadota bacterium]
MRARLVTLILAAGISLGGCAYGGGLGGLSVGATYGNPYGGYGGYGSRYGYGNRYGYGGYGSPYGYGGGYGGYGGGYGGYGGGFGYDPYFGGGYSPYYGSPFGWHNGFYYPGTGNYVYDRDRRRRSLNEAERRHWMQRLAEAAAAAARQGQTTSGATSTSSKSTRKLAPNWSGFNRQGASRTPPMRAGSTARAQRLEQARVRAEARQSERRATSRTRVQARSGNLGTTRPRSDD